MLDDRFDALSRFGVPGAAVLAIVLLGAGLLANCSMSRARAIRRLNDGLKSYQQGKTIEAIEEMKKATKADPEFAKPHYQMAQIYEMDLSDPDKAIQHYRQALELKPENANYAYKLGRVIASEGDHEDAITQFEKATQADEKHSRAWFRLGLSQRTLGEHAAAVESFMQAIKSSPRIPTAGVEIEGPTADHYYHALGDLYVEFDFYDKARRVYKNGIQNIPESARLYEGLGVSQLEQELYSEAAQSFEKALEFSSTRSTALFNLGVARQKMEQPKGAMKALNQFLQVAERSKNQARIAAAQGIIQEIEKEMASDKSEDKEK